jgi:cysteine dioxygenase
MNKIIDSIQKNGFKNSESILRNYSGSADYLPYITLNPNHYHRTKVFANDDFEIFVITWNKSQQSKIHDHSDNGCYMLMLQGELIEEIYSTSSTAAPIQTNIFKEGFIGYIDNTIGYHRILNPSETDIAVSLHVYSPPNHQVKLLG